MIQRGELKGVKLSAAAEADPLPENWCGPVALAQLLRLHGVESELTELAKLSGVTATGATLLGLQKAASSLGVSLIGVHAANLEEIEGPFIAHVNAAHFVLVEDVDATTVVLREAAKEAQSIPREDFIARWDGIALTQPHTATPNWRNW
ncbi:MAG: hypothetical protein HC888_13175, partial [Candidatus Competibacteraceae bacterium]|nr:hypothetical protein [Candidatus Competibacteraceae bacterium]